MYGYSPITLLITLSVSLPWEEHFLVEGFKRKQGKEEGKECGSRAIAASV